MIFKNFDLVISYKQNNVIREIILCKDFDSLFSSNFKDIKEYVIHIYYLKDIIDENDNYISGFTCDNNIAKLKIDKILKHLVHVYDINIDENIIAKIKYEPNYEILKMTKRLKREIKIFNKSGKEKITHFCKSNERLLMKLIKYSKLGYNKDTLTLMILSCIKNGYYGLKIKKEKKRHFFIYNMNGEVLSVYQSKNLIDNNIINIFTETLIYKYNVTKVICGVEGNEKNIHLNGFELNDFIFEKKCDVFIKKHYIELANDNPIRLHVSKNGYHILSNKMVENEFYVFIGEEIFLENDENNFKFYDGNKLFVNKSEFTIEHNYPKHLSFGINGPKMIVVHGIQDIINHLFSLFYNVAFKNDVSKNKIKNWMSNFSNFMYDKLSEKVRNETLQNEIFKIMLNIKEYLEGYLEFIRGFKKQDIHFDYSEFESQLMKLELLVYNDLYCDIMVSIVELWKKSTRILLNQVMNQNKNNKNKYLKFGNDIGYKFMIFLNKSIKKKDVEQYIIDKDIKMLNRLQNIYNKVSHAIDKSFVIKLMNRIEKRQMEVICWFSNLKKELSTFYIKYEYKYNEKLTYLELIWKILKMMKIDIINTKCVDMKNDYTTLCIYLKKIMKKLKIFSKDYENVIEILNYKYKYIKEIEHHNRKCTIKEKYWLLSIINDDKNNNVKYKSKEFEKIIYKIKYEDEKIDSPHLSIQKKDLTFKKLLNNVCLLNDPFKHNGSIVVESNINIHIQKIHSIIKVLKKNYETPHYYIKMDIFTLKILLNLSQMYKSMNISDTSTYYMLSFAIFDIKKKYDFDFKMEFDFKDQPQLYCDIESIKNMTKYILKYSKSSVKSLGFKEKLEMYKVYKMVKHTSKIIDGKNDAKVPIIYVKNILLIYRKMISLLKDCNAHSILDTNSLIKLYNDQYFVDIDLNVSFLSGLGNVNLSPYYEYLFKDKEGYEMFRDEQIGINSMNLSNNYLEKEIKF